MAVCFRGGHNKNINKLERVIFAVNFIVIVFFLNLNYAAADPLYSNDDPILQLNASTFYPSILGQKTAFIMEFYNSWCGHCIRYAPVWKQFAQDVQSWNKVAVVAAIDCADEENFPKCTHYRIPLFPTVKFLWINLTKDDLGEITPHDTDINVVRHNLIDFLEKNWDNGTKEFPFLKSRSEKSIENLWTKLPNHISEIFLILEPSGSYIGKEVILDTSAVENLTVLRVTNANEKLVEELHSRATIPAVPALLSLTRNGSIKTIALASSIESARDELRSKILLAYGMGKHYPTSQQITVSTEATVPITTAEESNMKPRFPEEKINLIDLQNTVFYLLNQEVALKAILIDDDLKSLKAFIAALTKTFPGNEPTMNFLRELYKFISKHNVSLQTSNMHNFMKTMQQSGDAYLPSMQDWSHCKGSKPLYRGYPCGLWTLFHTMTVQAYNKYLSGDMVNPQQVLISIKGYVLHFFSCGECAKHFKSMSMDMESQLRHPNDTVLWLWQAHNKVNKRLAGDKTEDPLHPKVQFPPKSLCPQCHQRLAQRDENSSPVYNTTAVLSFLRVYYSDIKVNPRTALDQDPRLARMLSVNSGNDPNGQYFMKNFRIFNNADISLCLILYVSSALLLLVVYFFIIIRRRKRRKFKTLLF